MPCPPTCPSGDRKIMGRAERALYWALCRSMQNFRNAGVPLTGIAGTHFVYWNLNAAAAVAALFRRRPPPVSFEGQPSLGMSACAAAAATP